MVCPNIKNVHQSQGLSDAQVGKAQIAYSLVTLVAYISYISAQLWKEQYSTAMMNSKICHEIKAVILKAVPSVTFGDCHRGCFISEK